MAPLRRAVRHPLRVVLALALCGCPSAPPEPDTSRPNAGPIDPVDPVDDPDPGPDDGTFDPVDADGDGFDETVDCDDLYAAVFPGADELCDGFDNDCDGQVDEADAVDAVLAYPDVDQDGHGDDNGAVASCALPDDYTWAGGDCDDGDATRSPGQPELCDGIDNDCDASTDEAGVISADGTAHATIQGAIDSAGNGAVITICDGVYDESLFVAATFQSLTLKSLNGPEATILDGGGTHMILSSQTQDTLTLEGLTFSNGSADEATVGAGGVYTTGTDQVVVINCHFLDNTHVEEPGALNVADGRATITDSVFRGNAAGGLGGAIYARDAVVEVADTLFEDNTAFHGGAIYASDAVFIVERTDFVGNIAKHGGAMTVGGLDYTSEVFDSTFTDNVATHGNGGGLYTYGPVTVTDSTFTGNSAETGGALSATSGSVLDGLTVVGNTATDIAGGIAIFGDLIVTNSTIHSNMAAKGGGAGTYVSTGSGTVTFTQIDWGTGATANDPSDLYLKSTSTSSWVTGDLTCNQYTGSCP